MLATTPYRMLGSRLQSSCEAKEKNTEFVFRGLEVPWEGIISTV